MNADTSQEVIFPIVATVDQGEIELTISAITQIGRDEETVTLTVEVILVNSVAAGIMLYVNFFGSVFYTE